MSIALHWPTIVGLCRSAYGATTVGLLFALLLCSGACVDPTLDSQSPGPAFEPPSWSSPPDGDLASHLMPGFAATIGVSGSASVRCMIMEDGHPFRCSVLNESVPGLRFGSAARVVAASGQIRTRRIEGEPAPTTIQFTVRFQAPDPSDRGRTWDGPEPGAERLRLARAVAESIPDDAIFAGDPMDGLDHDRRAVVEPWVQELIGMSAERQMEVRTIQLARLLDERELLGMLEGREVEPPTEEAWLDASPQLTLEEQTAILELRDRYCARFQCQPSD